MPGKLSENVLHKALLHVEDLMGRILTPFILLGDTAKGVKKESLAGLDKIQVGVMEKELIESNLRTLETLVGDIRTDYGFGYVVGGVPVEIHIIKKNIPIFENPDHAFYRAGEYAIPNPIEEYSKARWLI